MTMTMAGKSGSENFALEFRDIQATTMSLDSGGRFGLLAGRKYLTVISLEMKPGSVLVRLPYGAKYEISCTQWSSMPNVNLFGVTSGQRCDILQLAEGAELKYLARVKCHARVITDLDWNDLEPNLFVTSSFDSYVHVWDMRTPKDPGNEKPQVSLSALDGASQVRWSKWKAETVASCDGGHIKIWDIRKPTIPSEYIAAHASKINGLEWIAEDVVITAAQDCTVKFSRLGMQTAARSKGPALTYSTPVWRARPAPFGRGITVQSAPILRRDYGLLSLWDWKRLSSPVYTFQAHDIVEFAWKKSLSYDLLTWSRDQTLRIWSLPREVIELCGETMWPGAHENASGLSSDDMSSVTDTIAEDSEVSVRPAGKSPVKKERKEGSTERKSRKSVPNIMKRDDLLQDEFETVSETMPDNVNVDTEVERGLLRFSWKRDPKGRSVSIVILASFPISYPSNPPTFLVTSGGNDIDKNQLLKVLKQAAQQCTRKGEPCLNRCITEFATFMKAIKPEGPSSSLFPSHGVSNVPFPRTSGARFCFVGALIVFGRPAYLKRVKSNSENVTPRSLSALGDFLSQLTHDENLHKSRRSRRAEKKRAGFVTIFDVSPLLPFSRELAVNFNHVSRNANREKACKENAAVAKTYQKHSVAHAWQAAATISRFTTRPNNYSINLNDSLDCDDEETNWITYHPLGSKLIQNMISHYAEIRDVQTAASLACHYNVPEQLSTDSQHYLQQFNYQHHYPSAAVAGGSSEDDSNKNKNNTQQTHQLQQVKQPPGVGSPSPYHTVHGSDFDSVHSVVVNPLSDQSFYRQHRSNSWSDSLDDMKAVCALQENSFEPDTNTNAMTASAPANSIATNSTKTQFRGVILDPTTNGVYDSCKKSYAEILYRWGLLQQRAEVLKCLTERVEASTMRAYVEFVTECKRCQINVKGSQCSTCKTMISICSICQVPTRGLSTYCIVCGHGGHAEHIYEWFKNRIHCPTGCGCSCLTENMKAFK